MLDFLERAGPTPEERFALGALAWDFGLQARGFDQVEKAATADRSLAEPRDRFVSRRRGIAAPPGGFLVWKGSWVTPEEKESPEKGLVRWENEWVAPADRDKLARGRRKVGDQCVPDEKAELLRRGFKKHQDRWYTREEYEALRSDWSVGWETDTEHWHLKTNAGEDTLRELALAAEATWQECRKQHGGKELAVPSGRKLTLYDFAKFEDYRRYCVEQKAEDNLQAAGFARSDSLVAVGWNKTGNAGQFLAGRSSTG